MTFEQEQNEFLKYILEDKFFSTFNKQSIDEQLKSGISIELNITPVCNQHCSYCYLVQHGDELYPEEIRDWNNIISNLKIFLDYLLKIDCKNADFELFSGEIWGTDKGNQIFDLLLEYKKKGLSFVQIMIPSNVSFVEDKEATIKVQDYINKFDDLGVRLAFSASVDGPLLDKDVRPLNDPQKNKDRQSNFYDKLAHFCRYNTFGFHPMISAEAIEKWQDNFDWWMDYLKENKFNLRNSIMFLEVRNDYWTKEKIREYLKVLNHIFDYEFNEIYNRDIGKMTKHYMTLQAHLKNYEILSISPISKTFGCAISRSLCVRLGDLTICPCHRTSYKHLNYGQFVVEDGKIVDIKASNPMLANKLLLGNAITQLRCDRCKYNIICMRGCAGAQYETNLDPLIPIESVCDLMQAKINFLIRKYKQVGLIDYAEKNLKKTPFLLGILDGIRKVEDSSD